ncbi:MAG: hypothetical protein ABJG78_16695 [Cyclobacteriaceae bacterium]
MSSDEIAEFIFQINRFSGVPGILFFIGFLLKKKGNIRIVFYVLLASLLADTAIHYYTKYVYPNSHLIGTIWVITDYFLVSWMFLKLLAHKKKIILILLSVFAVGSTISMVFFFSLTESNTFIKSYPSVVFTYLSIIAFIEILKVGPTNKLIEYPIFWIITAIFLFSSITLLKNLFQYYLIFDLQVSKDLYLYVWFFGVGFNMIKNLLFFYAFILVWKGNPDYISLPKNVTS